jgi:hypothetical protein
LAKQKVKSKKKSQAIIDNGNGTFTVGSEMGAVSALQRMERLNEKISQIQQKYGIHEMMAEASALKKAATEFAIRESLESGSEDYAIEIDDDHYARLIRQGYDRRWLADEVDLQDPTIPRKAKPISSIIKKKFGSFTKGSEARKVWMRVTRRVVDPEALQEVIDEGILSEDEVAPALVQKLKSPYLRVFEN